jgi:hypothetical protein
MPVLVRLPVSEQIIAAELLSRNAQGIPGAIVFKGRWYVIATDHDWYLPHRMPDRAKGDDPTRVFCPRECPAYAVNRYDRPLRVVDMSATELMARARNTDAAGTEREALE